ncbi:hypothetical protein [Candidatus Frankia alpina]|uniref:hypothetical protein n=1 Tax=Candidatus Frankia alpina TaxID=2699483 RepID=UPI0013D26901|nr:hypothetical protein [Candidatus Frankia alpina]
MLDRPDSGVGCRGGSLAAAQHHRAFRLDEVVLAGPVDIARPHRHRRGQPRVAGADQAA